MLYVYIYILLLLLLLNYLLSSLRILLLVLLLLWWWWSSSSSLSSSLLYYYNYYISILYYIILYYNILYYIILYYIIYYIILYIIYILYTVLYPIIASAGTRTLPRRFLSSPPLLWESQRAPIPRAPLSNLTRPIDGPLMGKRNGIQYMYDGPLYIWYITSNGPEKHILYVWYWWPFNGENMGTYNIHITYNDKMYGKINGKSGFYHGMEWRYLFGACHVPSESLQDL